MQTLASHIHFTSQPPRQRLITILLVGALHAGIVSALFLSLAPVGPLLQHHTTVEVLPLPQVPRKPAQPIASPLHAVPSVSVPLPIIVITPTQTPSMIHAVPHAVTAPVAQEGAIAQPPEPVFLPARAIAATHTIPQYPSLAVRLGEQGDVHLVLTISETGAVVDARVTASSGYSQLDAAAVAWVEAHWRYEPAKRGDKPVTATSEAVVTFRLTGR